MLVIDHTDNACLVGSVAREAPASETSQKENLAVSLLMPPSNGDGGIRQTQRPPSDQANIARRRGNPELSVKVRARHGPYHPLITAGLAYTYRENEGDTRRRRRGSVYDGRRRVVTGRRSIVVPSPFVVSPVPAVRVSSVMPFMSAVISAVSGEKGRH
jgi:hypothetical protein